MLDFSPEAFGKYYLVDKIAVGGMAEIFKAKTYSHGGFENLVVIKRILSHLGENDEFVEMFIDEAKVSVALQHPNIVRIFDFGKIHDNYFIAMECVEGKDVRGVMRALAKKGEFLPLEYAVYIAQEACKGLDYAHKKTDIGGRSYGIVHRDISPSNILVSYEGQVKVADFGIAKAESNSYQTRDGVLKGKFEYMSPEQVEGKAVTSQSDIFAVGIILWEMVTGQRLFKTNSDVLTLNKIRSCDFDDPSAVHSRVPEDLEDIIIKALTRDPEHRYHTAADLRADLANWLDKPSEELQHGLHAFMEDLFVEHIGAERQRLEAGSAIAEQMYATAPPEQNWEVTASTMAGQPQRRALWPLFVALIPVLLLVPLLLGTVGVLAWVVTAGGEDPVEVATVGSIDIIVKPKAAIRINGEDRGEHERLVIDDLAPGTYEVVLAADGHEPWEFPVDVVAGQAVQIREKLYKVGEKPPEAAPQNGGDTTTPKQPAQPSGPPPMVAFTSDPAGAEVYVNGRRVGSTPLRWDKGAAGRSYKIEYRKDGYDSSFGTLNGLKGGQAKSYSLELTPKATAPGTLTVVVVGVGWANVYVDGEKLPKPAPLRNHPLAGGKHEIRVENAAMGLDHTETVNVVGGGNVTVRASGG